MVRRKLNPLFHNMVSPRGIFENNVTDMPYHNAIDETRIEMKEFINQLRTVFSTINILIMYKRS